MNSVTNVMVLLTVMLAVGVSSARAGERGEAERYDARIDRLERQVESLQQRLRQLEGAGASRKTRQKEGADPLLGTWLCSNSIQTYNLIFLGNGQVFIEETSLNTIKKGTWSRLDQNRISLPGGVPYEVTFKGDDEFELTDLNRRSTGTCKRQF